MARHSLTFADLELRHAGAETHADQVYRVLGRLVDWAALEARAATWRQPGTSKGRPRVPATVQLRIVALQAIWEISPPRCRQLLVDSYAARRFCQVQGVAAVPAVSSLNNYRRFLASHQLATMVPDAIAAALAADGRFLRVGRYRPPRILAGAAS